VDGCIPKPDLEKRKEAALAAQELALKNGLTGVHTCESLNEWQALAALEQEGKLKLRVHHLLQAGDLADAEAMGLKPGHGSDRLWVGHLKLFADGSLGAGTALLCEDYSDEPGCCGLPFLEVPELNQKVAEGYRRGYSVAIHAIGDLAGKNALDAIARGRTLHPGPRRDRIEHVQLHRPEDLERYKALDVVASVQPAFVATDWAVAERRWAKRCKTRGYAWKTILERGIRMQFGSDAPVEMINPIYGLQAAVLRQDTKLQPPGGWQPHERLSLEQSLAGYSATAAWSSNKDNCLGTLKPGNWADLTVFEKDLSRVAPQEWLQVEPVLTMIGGDLVFSR
jgi:predicted amidohydrolase YtcJ